MHDYLMLLPIACFFFAIDFFHLLVYYIGVLGLRVSLLHVFFCHQSFSLISLSYRRLKFIGIFDEHSS